MQDTEDLGILFDLFGSNRSLPGPVLSSATEIEYLRQKYSAVEDIVGSLRPEVMLRDCRLSTRTHARERLESGPRTANSVCVGAVISVFGSGG